MQKDQIEKNDAVTEKYPSILYTSIDNNIAEENFVTKINSISDSQIIQCFSNCSYNIL